LVQLVDILWPHF